MRTVMATVLVLFAAGYVATYAGSSATGGDGASATQSTASVADDDGWRRTTHGWERCDQWARITPAQLKAPVPKSIHPITLAAGQILAVIGLWLLTRLAGKSRRDEVTQPIEGERGHSQRVRVTGA